MSGWSGAVDEGLLLKSLKMQMILLLIMLFPICQKVSGSGRDI
jgi:hypothetical protein